MYGKKKPAAARRRHRAAAALVAALMVLVVPVWTEVSVGAVDLEKTCSLTVKTGQEGTAEAERPELTVDLYQVAEAAPVKEEGTGNLYDSYTLKALAGYQALQEDLDTLTGYGEGERGEGEVHGGDYRRLAAEAAKVSLGIQGELKEGEAVESVSPLTPVATVKPGEKAEGLKPGLYLAVPHGSALKAVKDYALAAGGGEIATVAYGRDAIYKYSPELIALPQREQTGTGGNSGEQYAWVYEVEATLKAETGYRYTSLKIIKQTEPALSEGEERITGEDHFVYRIEAQLGGKNVYSSVVMLTLSGEENQAQTTLRNIIPPGAKITVEEVYTGASHALSGEGSVIIASAKEDGEDGTPGNEAAFVNVHTGVDIGGGAIENRFVYDKKEDGSGSWEWTPEPADAANPGVQEPDDTEMP